MKGYAENIEKLTLDNTNFRQVLYTARYCQLVVMSLNPGEEIGMEIHNGDQFLRFESGQGKAVVNGIEHLINNGSVVIVPAGVQHNIINISPTEPMKLYTLYSPHITKTKLSMSPSRKRRATASTLRVQLLKYSFRGRKLVK